MNDSSHYPTGVCRTCEQFVSTTMILKAKYEKTNQVLSVLLDPSEVYKNNTNDYEGTIDEDKYENCEEVTDIKNDKSEVYNPREKIVPKKEKVSTIIGAIENENTTLGEGNEDFLNDHCDTTNDKASQSNCWLILGKENTQITSNSMNSDSDWDDNLNNLEKNNNETSDSEIQNNITPYKVRVNDDQGNSELKFPALYSYMKCSNISLSDQNYLCPICKKEFLTIVNFINHTKNHKTLRTYFHKSLKVSKKSRFVADSRLSGTIFNKVDILHKCLYCREETSIENFRDHVADHLKKGEFPCPKCDKVFRQPSHRKAHMTLLHNTGESAYQCDDCDKGFGSKYFYKCHMLTHMKFEEELQYQCDYCDKGFANKILLKRHIRRHLNNKGFWFVPKSIKCKTCFSTFKTTDDLEKHRKAPCQPHTTISPNGSGVWKCDVCQKSFNASYKAYKFNHECIKININKRYLCEICGSKVINIKAHMQTHEPKMDPLVCQNCDKKLSNKVSLVKHMRLHTGEKPYACRYCDKSFRRYSNRFTHEKIHMAIKKHICAICGKGFLESVYLRKHLQTVHKNCSTINSAIGDPFKTEIVDDAHNLLMR